MRKWAGLVVVGIIGISIGVYWGFVKNSNGPDPGPRNDDRLTRQQPFDDGDAEASEVIEPLIVDRGVAASIPPPVVNTIPMERATWTHESPPTPRPDGQVRRMPYADEVEIPALLFDPVRWILETGFPRLNRVDDPSEQAEPMGTTPRE